MKIKRLPYRLTVAKYDRLPACPDGFFSLSRAEGEISLLCESDRCPVGATHREDGWVAFMAEGPLDFSLVGILADLSAALAEAGIAIFALSTYDTDYLLVKEDRAADACVALKEKGYDIRI